MAERSISSAWLMTVRPFWAAMHMASYITFDSRTPLPSSLIKRRFFGNARRWLTVLPSKSFVMDTHWFTSHRPTRRASSITLCAMAPVEHTGLVLGIQFTNV